MSSGHDVSEYELGSSGLPAMFHHNNRGKIDSKSREIKRKNRLKIEKNDSLFKKGNKQKFLVWYDDPPGGSGDFHVCRIAE